MTTPEKDLDVSANVLRTATYTSVNQKGTISKQTSLDALVQKYFLYANIKGRIVNSFLPGLDSANTVGGAAYPRLTTNVFRDLNNIIVAMSANFTLSPDMMQVDPKQYTKILYYMTVAAVSPYATDEIRTFLKDTLSSKIGEYICAKTIVDTASSTIAGSTITILGGVAPATTYTNCDAVGTASQPGATGTTYTNVLKAFDVYNYFVGLNKTLVASDSVYKYMMAYLALITNMFYVCMRFAIMYTLSTEMSQSQSAARGFTTTYPNAMVVTDTKLTNDLKTLMQYIIVLRSTLLSYEGAMSYLYQDVGETTQIVNANNASLSKTNSSYRSQKNILSVLREKNSRLEAEKNVVTNNVRMTFVVLVVFVAIMLGLFLYDGFPADDKAMGIITVNGLVAFAIVAAAIYNMTRSGTK